MHESLTIQTRGPGLYEITDSVAGIVARAADSGVVTLFVQHTSCSLLIQENADPDVQVDLMAYFQRLAPRADDPSMRYLRHTQEGADDMPAHIKAALLPISLSIPVMDGRMRLGTWQGIYLVEHRDRPHERRVALHFLRDATQV